MQLKYFPLLEAKVSRWLHDRRKPEKWIIYKKIIFKYCAESERKICSWSHDRRTDEKWIIHRKVRIEYFANSKQRCRVDYMNDEDATQEKLAQRSNSNTSLIQRKDLQFITWRGSTLQMNNRNKRSTQIFCIIESKDLQFITSSTITREMNNS